MTTFEHWRAPSSRFAPARSDRKPTKKYDIRLVDQFYVYCQALARTERHRDEAYQRSRISARTPALERPDPRGGALLLRGGARRTGHALLTLAAAAS